MAEQGSTFWRWFDRLLDGMAVFAGVLLALQVVSVTINVALRYLFNGGIYGINTWNEWSLLWVAFLGFAWLQRERGHVSMELLKDMYALRMRSVFELAVCLLGAVVSVVLIWYGSTTTWQYWVENRYDYFKLAEILVAPVYAIIPFGSFVLLIQLIRDAMYEIKTFGTPRHSSFVDRF